MKGLLYISHLRNFVKALFLWMCLTAGLKAAGQSTPETYIQTLSGSSLTAGASCEVKDDKFQNPGVDWNTITNISVYDVVTFEIRQDTSLYYYNKPFTATVTFSIQYYTSPDQITPTELNNVQLKVRFDTAQGSPYPGTAMFKFRGAYRVKVTVNSISSTELGTPLPAIFRLKNEIFITRKYQFAGTNSDVTTYSLNRRQLAVHWNPAAYPGAEEYDLEWTPIDDSSAAAASIRDHFTSGGLINIPDDTLNAWLYHNATRITTAGYGYTINLPYNSGYLIYRVRGVQTDVNGARQATTWCYKALQGGSTGSSAVLIAGMDDSLNWQYAGTFAEEGKRKEVVSYFDGTLRNRQSVTVSNSENRSIIGETLYDAMGRPAVNVLPVPATDSILQFYPSFNRNAAGTAPYNYSNLGQGACDINAQAMSTTSGASEYYSANNPFPKANEYFFNKYIPDAGGYPFSVTAYTADNTGRISRQGGVGPAFQPGGGHDTKYYYGKPQQSELDRLFGSEAGNEQHFLKNMVVDPNGQVSVSYIDANGKTVATALAGSSPANLHGLPGADIAAVADTEDLIQADNLAYHPGDYSITVNASFTVPVNGNYDFNYQLDPLSLNTAYGTDKTLQICSDCYYDLQITVTDDCGQVVHQETKDAGTVFDTLCAPPPISGNFSLANLSIGSYNIGYKLQVSKAALDFYDNRFVRVNTDLKTPADFIREQLENADFENCFSDCKTCKAALGTLPDFTARFTGLFTQYGIAYDTGYQAWLSKLYDSLYAHCEAIQCPVDTSVCYNNYQTMLQDVTPGGQYALYDSAYQPAEPQISVLPYYSATVFTDENGKPDSVFNNEGMLVPPSQLSPEEFIRNFKSSWADSLVTHHPEYCFYKWCLANEASEEFDNEVMNDLQDAPSARNRGFFDMDNYLQLFQSDPFFQSTGAGYYLAQAMQDSMTYYSRSLGMPYDSGNALPVDISVPSRDPNIPLYEASRSVTFDQGFSSIANDDFKAIIIPGSQYKHGGYYDILGVAKWMATCGQLGMPIDSCVVCQACINDDLVWNTYKILYMKLKARMYWTAMADSDNPYFKNCKNCYIGANEISGAPVPSSDCPDDPRASLYAGKRRVYTNLDPDEILASLNLQDTTSLKQGAQQSADSLARVNVAYMADVWMTKLNSCTADTSLLSQIRRGLIAVAQQAVDSLHPQGASTLPAGVTASADGRNYTGFDDVITQILGPGAINDSCTSDLVASPYPYGKQAQFMDIGVFKTDSSVCAALSTLQGEWQAASFSGSFHQYLQAYLGSDYKLTETQLDELEQSCTTCHYLLKENLNLPAVFRAGSPSPLTCSEVQASFNEVLSKYPGLTPDNQNYEDLITNYINHRYGYSLGYNDYLYFKDSVCPANGLATLYNRSVEVEATVDTNACVAQQFGMAVTNADIAYQSYIDSVHRDFREAFLTKCMNVQPRLTMTGSLWEYQYTLYYYDQAGNLVKTVPPKGVQLLSRAAVDSVQLYRKYGRSDCYRYSNYLTVNPPAGNLAYYQLTPDSRFYTGANPFTLEMWVKLSDFSDQGLASNFYHTGTDNGLDDAGFSFSLSGGRLVFYLSAGVSLFSGPNPLNPSEIIHTALQLGYVKMASDDISPYLHTGEWTHIAVERTGATSAVFYVNGIPVPYTITDSYPFQYGNSSIDPPAGAPLKIGGSLDSLNHLMGLHQATVKQFRLYKRALSYSEIRQNLFSACLTPANQTGLTVWMPLNNTAISDIAAGTAGQEVGDASWFTLSQSLWPVYPKHTLETYYRYNSLNEVVQTTSPDGGTTQSWYDRLGRLLASQNSEQRHPVNGGSSNRYSYTKYDALGRIIEVGGKSGAADLNTIDTKDSAAVSTWLASGTNGQTTFTLYDGDANYNADITPYQANLRKRVAAAYYSDNGNMSNYNAATHYSYDIEGNVKTLWQDIKDLETVDPTTGLKRIDYDYDIISGKVNEVNYQKGKGDQFYYKYTYDADNRVIAAATSRDGLIWHNDASYRYYLHGPLARLELGTDKVQGVDYAYTLQGWLKGINSSFLGADKDMAQDGNSSGIYAPFARDVYSLSLGYYSNDYVPIGGSGANAFSLSYGAPGSLTNSGNQLFNGNISNSTLGLSNLNSSLPVGYSYGYDQLNRITGMRQHTIASGVNSWSNSNIINDYKEDVAYDANGNILKYLRNGTTQGGNPLGMDSLTYFYNANTNQLNVIHDSVPAGNYSVDIDNQNANNYAYDSIGNLIKDNSVGLSDVQWTVYGKIKEGTSAGAIEQYSYDANNNRVIKIGQYGSVIGKQYYIRDAQGNILATYSYDGSTLKWTEQDLYGSSRVGLWSWNNTIPTRVMLPQSETDTLSNWYLLGSRDYELTNHLGNVLSVITDKKIGVSSNNSTVDYYRAEILSQTDYYPFGMEEPGRSTSAIPYPYAFNGKRMENVELYTSNQYDYGMRFYDARTGRFYSVDPLTGKYPELTPYQFASNSPISGIDIDGKEFGYNDWAFRVFIEPFLDFVGGANELKQGVEREVAVKSGKMGYQNPEVPVSVQQRYARQDLLRATSDKVSGVAKMEVASADVVSNIMVAGEGVSLVTKTTGKVGADILERFLGRKLGQQIEKKAIIETTEQGVAKEVANRLNKTISVQKQARHILGTAPVNEAGQITKGYLNSLTDAQSVLDAVHSGEATFLGTNKAGFPVYRFNDVTGTNVNLGAGISKQTTNVFIIKGTVSPSVVPTNPLFKP